MKARYKIIIPIIAVLAIGLFYLYIVANGYTGYIEGISLLYFYETDPDKILAEHQLLSGIIDITDVDLEEVPRIKDMLSVALDQEFPLKDDGFNVFDDNFNSYWINRDGKDIRVQIGMSYEDTKSYGNWLSDNISGHLMKYQDRYFVFSQWIA
jgi:hypothetical protein